MATKLTDLPNELLLHVFSFVDATTLLRISFSSRSLQSLCVLQAWPALAARAAGVRTIVKCNSTQLWSPAAWKRFVMSLQTHPTARVLHVAVHLNRGDSVRSLALQHGVCMADLLRTNALFSEHHLATRDRVYVPLVNDERVKAVTGLPKSAQRPSVVRDCTLAGRNFLVVRFLNSPIMLDETNALARREEAVRELIVRLVSRGFSAGEDEVRYYLEDNDFNLSRAIKALVRDREWCASTETAHAFGSPSE